MSAVAYAARTHAPTGFATSALRRVFDEAPHFPRVSYDKTACRAVPNARMGHYPYAQINNKATVAWLIFDLDHANPYVWQDEGLPAPNLIVQNPKNGHAHLFYAIEPVCVSERARTKPVHFMRAVYAAMASRLRADPNYHGGPVAKMPGHPWWRTTELHAYVYRLAELELPETGQQNARWRKRPTAPDPLRGNSRHCAIFDRLRQFAYAAVTWHKAHGSFSSFMRQLEVKADEYNDFRHKGFSADLPLSSLRATVKSVANWTWNKYTGQGKGRGIMGLDPALPLADRRRMAAARTAKLRADKTEARIRHAVARLAAEGRRITQVAVAKLADLTRQTVAKFKSLLTHTPASVPVGNVKFARYQVSADLRVVRADAAIGFDASSFAASENAALSHSSSNAIQQATLDARTQLCGPERLPAHPPFSISTVENQPSSSLLAGCFGSSPSPSG